MSSLIAWSCGGGMFMYCRVGVNQTLVLIFAKQNIEVCDRSSNWRRTTRPVYFEVNGSDLAGIKGGEVAITNLHSCDGPDFVIEVHFSIAQDTDANRVLGSTSIREANARLKCVYFPVVQGKENIETILEQLEADGCRVAETYESFSRVSIRRLGRLLPDARWGLLPFMEERHKKGDKAHLSRRSFSRVKCFIDTDVGFSPTPSKTDLAQHNPFACALQKIGRPLDGIKEIEVKIYRQGKLLTPLQLEKEYCDWIIRMHECYDEEVHSGEDKAGVIINPGNKKALGVSSSVVRVHRWIKRKGVSWKYGQKIKISRGACAGVHNNVYATLEYFLLEGLQGDCGGEARIMCRPLGVPEDQGCILNKQDGVVSLEVQSSLSVPIGVIDSRKLVTVEKSEWECQLKKHRLKVPSSIDLPNASPCEELGGVHAALPVHAPIPAGQDPPKEIIAAIRPANFSYSTTPKKLNQKYIVKNRMEMSMEVPADTLAAVKANQELVSSLPSGSEESADDPSPRPIAIEPPPASKRLLVPAGESILGPSSHSENLPLGHPSTIPPPPQEAPPTTSAPRAMDEVLPLSAQEKADLERLKLIQPLEEESNANHPRDLLPSLAAAPPHVAKAKWEEFLDLLESGYAELVVDSKKEWRAKTLFQEICNGSPSFMPSKALQEASDTFAVSFVEAVDTIRVNTHKLPYLIFGERRGLAIKDELTSRRKDALLFYKDYKAVDGKVQRLEKEKEELEARLKTVQGKLDQHKAKRSSLGNSNRQELKKYQELEKEFDSQHRMAQTHEEERKKITEENSTLEFNLRSFVTKARALLAKWK